MWQKLPTFRPLAATMAVRVIMISQTQQQLLSQPVIAYSIKQVWILSQRNDASVTADGGDLAGFTADVEFNVEDTANAIAAEVSASGFGAGGLDEANNLTVSGGNVDVAEAADIQAISGYDGSASDYDITDTAAALISAGDSMLNKAGVDIVTANDASVTAKIGGDLAGFTADVDFNEGYSQCDSSRGIGFWIWCWWIR